MQELLRNPLGLIRRDALPATQIGWVELNGAHIEELDVESRADGVGRNSQPSESSAVAPHPMS